MTIDQIVGLLCLLVPFLAFGACAVASVIDATRPAPAEGAWLVFWFAIALAAIQVAGVLLILS